MKFGSTILSWSVYYDDMSIDTTQGYKTFTVICKGLAVVSNILLIVLLIIVLV